MIVGPGRLITFREQVPDKSIGEGLIEITAEVFLPVFGNPSNFGDHGIQFSTGICALIATGIAVDDNTAVSANEVVVTIGYE